MEDKNFILVDVHSLNRPTHTINMETVITILVIIIALLLWREIHGHLQRVNGLEKRIADLEKANLQRLPYPAFEEILNGMAALDVLERESEFKQDVIKNAKAHFANAMAAGTKRQVK